MDKLTKIESLSQEKLQEVWVEILKKDKFSGISVKVNCIIDFIINIIAL